VINALFFNDYQEEQSEFGFERWAAKGIGVVGPPLLGGTAKGCEKAAEKAEGNQ